MRINGKFRQVLNPATGLMEWSPWPTTREEAIEEKAIKYYPPDWICPVCKGHSVFYTSTNINACCAHRMAGEEYMKAVAAGEPTSIHAAREQGKNYYWGYEPNSLCGHPGKKTLSGKCVFCIDHKENSPRMVALRAKETWYMPAADDPCKRGHVAMRRVSNGGCKQCEEEDKAAYHEARGNLGTGDRRFDPTRIDRVAPDTFISRADAKALGFTVYRTTTTCLRGHVNPWRYVTTGNCIECINQK